jgi:hypothetical protein
MKYMTLYPTGQNNSSKIISNHTSNCIVKEKQDIWCPGRVLNQAAPEYKSDHMTMAGNISDIVPEYNMHPRELNMAKNMGLAGE